MAAPHPAVLLHLVIARMDRARWDGDAAAYADAQTSMADLRIYEAAYHGVPLKYVDPSLGWWTIPENICRACWQTIDGPVFAAGIEGWCMHFHPEHRPGYDRPEPRPLNELHPAGVPHPRPSCRSRLAHYDG